MGLTSKQVCGDGHAWSQVNVSPDRAKHAQGIFKDDRVEVVTNSTEAQQQHSQQRQTKQNSPLRCPRCDSDRTKFCYYNNYSRSQPRHFCKACRRHWTNGGTLRNVPVGGDRKNKRQKTSHAGATTEDNNTTQQHQQQQHQQPEQLELPVPFVTAADDVLCRQGAGGVLLLGPTSSSSPSDDYLNSSIDLGSSTGNMLSSLFPLPPFPPLASALFTGYDHVAGSDSAFPFFPFARQPVDHAQEESKLIDGVVSFPASLVGAATGFSLFQSRLPSFGLPSADLIMQPTTTITTPLATTTIKGGGGVGYWWEGFVPQDSKF